MNEKSQILIYKAADGNIRIEVHLEDETVWLSQKMMANLFKCSTDNISLHLKNIFKEQELLVDSVVEEFSITASDGKTYKTKHYSLDAIIAVGYRVNSKSATQFRIWATQRLKEYIIKGFSLNDERFKSGNSMNYFNELQERIRQIRISERFFYQKIKDIYKTSLDYDSRNKKTIDFFKIVQNKLLWAISEQTAAELVYRRVDSKLPLLGMQSFDKKDAVAIRKSDVSIAKNFLKEDEIKLLGIIVEQYLAFAESMAQQHRPMYMKDWAEQLDVIIKMNGRELLTHAGRVSHNLALEKAGEEYEKFRKKHKKDELEQSLQELENDIKNLDVT